MSSFEALLIDRRPDAIDPVYDRLIEELPLGRRPYHTNRFRIYFRVPEGHSLIGRFGAALFENFSDCFDQDAAVVAVDRRRFNGKPVLRFTGDTPGPDIHNDYVYRLGMDDAAGFTVQTLRRYFEDDKDAVLRALIAMAMQLVRPVSLMSRQLGRVATVAPAVAPAPIAPLAYAAAANYMSKSHLYRWMVLATARDLQKNLMMPGLSELVPSLWIADFAVELSKRHFLAGRRAWRIAPVSTLCGDGQAPADPRAYFFETSAIERVTRPEFLPGRDYFNSQTKVIWANLLRSFAAQNNLDVIDQAAFSDGVFEQGVSFTEADYDTRAACVSGAEQIIAMFPDLLPVSR